MQQYYMTKGAARKNISVAAVLLMVGVHITHADGFQIIVMQGIAAKRLGAAMNTATGRSGRLCLGERKKE